MRLGLPVLSAVLVLDTVVMPGALRPKLMATSLAVMIFTLMSIGHRRQFVLHFAALLLVTDGCHQLRISLIDKARTRTFFGIYTVQATPVSRQLLHGTTLHGFQSLRTADRLRPASYYAPGSGAGLTFRAAPQLFGPSARLGVVGLGTGTLACYATPGETLTIFEIDPAVVHIARDTGQFTYLRGCKPDARIVLGDARLTLAQVAPASFDLLAVDAFSSDAIPLHLMTREAFAIYGRALAPGGVLLVHVSNRFLALEPVVAAIARAEGWSAARRDFWPNAAEAARGDTKSTWLAMTRTPERLAVLEAVTGAGLWQPLRPDPQLTAWSDDFASVLPVIKAFRPPEVTGEPSSPTR